MMKKFVNRVVVALVITVMAGSLALAGTKSEKVTFYNDLNVNGTLVKKGTYKVKFDEQTGELTILKGKEVVAKATARMEERTNRNRPTRTEVISALRDNQDVLVGMTFAGDNETLVITGGNDSTVGR